MSRANYRELPLERSERGRSERAGIPILLHFPHYFVKICCRIRHRRKFMPINSCFRRVIPLTTIILLLFSGCSTCTNAQDTANSKKSEPTPNFDKDLSNYPEFYKKRIIAFRTQIRKAKTKQAKVLTAINILKDENSAYRRDAIEFLSEVKAKEAVPSIVSAGDEKDLRADAAFALGEIKDLKAFDFLLKCLYDSNDNVRGNASLALKKISRKEFGYNYSDPEDVRNRAAKLWENWWLENKKDFQVTEPTDEEIKDAEEKWEKYGKPLMERLKSEK
jgi:hypothetical protein